MCNPYLCGSLSQLYVHRGLNLLLLLIHLIVLALSYGIVVLRHFGAESLGLLLEENPSRRAGIFIHSPFRRGKKNLHEELS